MVNKLCKYSYLHALPGTAQLQIGLTGNRGLIENSKDTVGEILN